MFRFIGGPARCGKTTLTQKAQQHYQGQLISLDNMRRSFISLASSENKTILKPNASINDYTIDEWLVLMRKRDRKVWQGAEAYLAAATKLNDDVLIEGCLWPDYVNRLDVDYRAVFLVDTSLDHVKRIIAAAQNENTHNNWMKDRSEKWLTKWAEYNIERSKLFIKLASQANLPVFDVGEVGFDEAQSAALSYLFDK